MVTQDVSIPGAPFEIARIGIEDGRLFYTRQGDSLVSPGPTKPGGESAHRRPARDPQGSEVTWLVLAATAPWQRDNPSSASRGSHPDAAGNR